MKFTLALLVTLVVSGSGSVLRSREHEQPPKNHIEEEWSRFFPEISHPKIKERLFKDGGEYRYLYDSQILTGMPTVHYQFSGARIRAVVKIQLGQKDLMQIEKVFVGSLHERFVSDPQTLVELSAFEPVKPEDAPFEEVLRKPVRFSYENGKINDFEVTEGDPTWSINIKRAILSTFHLSLTDREEPIDEVRREKLARLNTPRNEATGSGKKSSSTPNNDSDDSEYFTVVEDGVAGRCEVSYLVMEIPDEDENLYPIDDVSGQQAGQYESAPGMSGRRDSGKPRGPRAVPSDADLPVLNVTKTFDRRNCEFRPFVFKGLHLSTACPNCEEDPESYFDLLESSAHTRYNITGTKEQYIIDSAISEAVYKITPRSHYAGSMVAYANITTILIESGPIKQEIRFPEGYTVHIDGLHMINAHFLRREGDKIFYDAPETDKPILQKPEYWPTVAQKPQKIKALFEKLVHGMEPREGKYLEIDTDISVLVEDIIRLMDKAFLDELEQIHNAIKSVSVAGVEKEEIEHLFADLLVATGSNCTFTYLKKLLTEKHLQGPVVQDVLALLPFKMQTDKISQTLIEEYMDMCEDEDLKTDPFVERACWLSFGTLVHKACEHQWYGERSWLDVMEDSSKQSGSEPGRRLPARRPRQTGPRGEHKYTDEMPPRCPPETRERVIQKVTDLLKNAESDEKKILAIKMMGNMGMNETIDELIDIAEDDSIPIYVRTQAIYALKYTATDYPEMVYDSLLPLYRQTNQSTQVRIATLVTILASRPDLPILEDIAQSLNREPDLDVASYTYSAMASLANSTHPCLQNLTRDLILALEHAKPVNSDIRHSKSFHHGTYIDHMKRGLFWEVNHVMDRDAPVPRAGNFRLHATVMDKSFDLIEFGYETEGFGDAIRKYVGNYSKEAMEEILSGHASRRPRAASGDSETPDLEQIDQLLNIQPQPPKDIRGTAYLKLFGQQTRFLVINPQTISRTIVDVITRSHNLIPKLTGEGLPMDQRRATTLMDVRVDFPTILGVPISTSIVAPVVASIKGKLKVHMEPKPAAGFSMLKNVPHKLLVESDVKTSIAGEIHSKMSVFLGFLKIGTGVRTRMSFNAPISGKFEFNMADRMTKLVLDMPETPFKLVNISSYPVTYVLHYSRNQMTYQPKPLPTGHLGPHAHPEHTDSDESDEMPTRPSHPMSHGPQGEGFVRVNISDTRTDMITGTGHVVMPRLFGLPIPNMDMWEIPTPMFVKSRKIHFQVGHESVAARIDFKSKMEYPDTRIPTALLPVVGAKCELEVKVTPNPGHKKLVLTIFERSEFTHTHSEKELLSKLKDKMPDMPLKDLSSPMDMDKRAKMGHSLQMLVNSQGNESPQEWTTRGLLALVYSMDGRFIKFVAGMNSKVPMLPKKFCLTAEVKKPERNGMWFVTPQESINKSVQGNLEASWGEECGNEKYFKLRLRYQKTKEQMEVEKNDLYDENGIPVPLDVAHEVRGGEGLFNSLYKQCEEDRQRGAFFSKECIDFAIWYSDLLRLKFDIEYKEVSRPIRNIMSKLERLMKFNYYWNTDIKDVDVHNPENRINAMLEFSADRSYMDIKYQTPHTNVSIINIDLPVDVQPISALVPWTPVRLVGLAMYPSCTISGPKINTFDDVSDEMPLSQCWHVMAKDATDEKLFAVLVAAAGKNTIAKKVAVIFKDHKIEILPTGPVQGSPSSPPSIRSFVVKYNGQELRDAMSPEKRTTIPPNIPEDKEELASIMLIKPEDSGNKEPILAIISRPTGIKVLFDGSSVTVVPSPFWKNGLLGLCGSYDGQPWDDKLLPNKTMADEPVEVSRAFLLNTRNCDQQIPESTPNKLPKSRIL